MNNIIECIEEAYGNSGESSESLKIKNMVKAAFDQKHLSWLSARKKDLSFPAWDRTGVPDEILNPDLDFPPGPEEASGDHSHDGPARPEEASGDRSHMEPPGDYPASRKKLDKLLYS